MKLLQTKDNVTAPDATYPYGTMRDRALGTPGSKVNTDFMTDYVQFFEKMFAESGLTANGNPDNATNGFQLWEAAQIAVKGYKSYVARISQTGTSSPTANVIKDEIGGLAWSRVSAGYYGITGSSINDDTKVFANIITEEDTLMFAKPSSGVVEVKTKDLGTVSLDGLLSDTRIEIRLYF